MHFLPRSLRSILLFLSLGLLLAVLLPTQTTQSQTSPLRIGFMGDSVLDEYRGVDNRGGSYANGTFNWVEQMVIFRGIDAGPWGTYPEPRRTGYAYNWARSAANSGSLLSSGQHTGLAAQVAAGQIDLVILAIGGNDFAPWAGGDYSEIYNGTLSGTALQNSINSVINNITIAVNTILNARSIPFIITTIGDFGSSPQILTNPSYSDPVKRQRVSVAIQAVNDGIVALAVSRGLTVFDANAFASEFFNLITNGMLVIDGVSINPVGFGDEPHNLVLGDHIHAGTVLEGLLANAYLATINSMLDPDIPIFTNQEILSHANLSSLTNTPPVATGDTVTTNQNTSVTVTYANLLANDTDANNDPLNIAQFTQPAHGTVTAVCTGLVYTPANNYIGTDSFTYIVNDGHGGNATGVVSITVGAPPPPNHNPTANSDSLTTVQDTPASITYAVLLANDSDPDNDTLTVASFTQPLRGSVTSNTSGLIYTPASSYSGSDTFGYTVNDGHGGSASASVVVTITPAPPQNHAPSALDDTLSTIEDTPASITYAVLLANDHDPDNDTLTVASFTQPLHGSVSSDPNGLTYTPVSDYFGMDTFSYIISDGRGGNASAFVVVTVTPINTENHAPSAANDTLTIEHDSAALITYAVLLANDHDPDNDPLTVISFTQPLHGNVSSDGSGLTYTPASGYAGSDTFTYTISDGRDGSASASVLITITPPQNHAPTAANDSYATDEDVALTVPAATGVLNNDSDPDGNNLSTAVVTVPTKGILSLNSNGSFTYTPNPNANGGDSFTYTATDGNAISNLATVSITINPVNDVPVAVNNAYSTDQDTVLTITATTGILANDTDFDGDMLTAAVVTGPTKGILSLNSNGSFIYTPNPNVSGSDSFTYTATDGNAISNLATVSITINAVNHAPVAVNDSYSTAEDTALITTTTNSVLSNDTDVDGNVLTAALVTGPTKGVLTLNSNGTFTYTPNANVNGSDSFTYRTSDGLLNSGNATVTITITAVNDAPVATNDTYTTTANSVLTTTTANGVLLNDIDVEGAALTASLVTGPTNGMLTLNSNGTFTYTPNANYSGSDSFTYRAGDGSLTSNLATVSITINPSTPTPHTLTVQVSGGADDVYEDGSTLTTTGSTVTIGSGSNPATAYTGVRFTNVTIPRGATITSVQLEVYSPSQQWIQMNLQIAGELNPTSAAFSTSSRPSARPLTVARVTSNTNTQWLANTWYNFPGLQAILQEIINQTGWQSGNTLSIIIHPTGTATFARKTVRSFEGGATQAMRLVITYNS